MERKWTMQKPAENRYPINQLLKKRWSPRAFANAPIDREDLLRLFEAARWSPSSGNQQPWSFVVVTNQDPQAHHDFVGTLTGQNPVWAQHAPVLVLGVVQRERAPGKPNRYAMYDLGQAVANLTVQATELGLSVRQMGGFDHDKARQTFGIPEEYDPVVSIAIGYAGSIEDLPGGMAEQERAPRHRKEIEEFVFGSEWGRTFDVYSAEVDEGAERIFSR
jgi:nitroreductase